VSKPAPPLHLVPQTDPIELCELLFALSRRHEQPFSVVAVTVGEADGRTLEQLERSIASALRRTDLLLRWTDGRRYAAFCPSTRAEGAKELCQRIRSSSLAVPLRCGTATFPEHALVLDDLIDAAFADAQAGGGPGPAATDRASGLLRIRRLLNSRLERTPERRFAALAKRSFDLAFSAATAPLWLPALGLIAAAIKLSAPREPVFFPQERTGRGGRRFRMYKFRTMIPNAEQVKADYAHLSRLRWPDFKIENDPRITRLGRLLRKTSLDELPQVFNVLRGEMSWVGPRPTSFAAETYEIWQTARLDVIPGVTGLWQVEGRARAEFDERLRLDIAYIDRRSLRFDVEILLRTAREIVQPRGGH